MIERILSAVCPENICSKMVKSPFTINESESVLNVYVSSLFCFVTTHALEVHPLILFFWWKIDFSLKVCLALCCVCLRSRACTTWAMCSRCHQKIYLKLMPNIWIYLGLGCKTKRSWFYQPVDTEVTVDRNHWLVSWSVSPIHLLQILAENFVWEWCYPSFHMNSLLWSFWLPRDQYRSKPFTRWQNWD